MKTILVPVDFSDVTPHVVNVARSMAAAFDCQIAILHVIEPEPDFVGFEPGPSSARLSVAQDFKTERKQLEELKDRLLAEGREVISIATQGASADTILHEAQKHDAEWIVMGSHGHGALYELLVGSVTHGVMKKSRCPVVVVPSRTQL